MFSAVPAHELDTVCPPVARARKSLIIVKHLVHNWRCRFRSALGETQSSIGSTHARKSVAESLDYVDRVYRDYVFYGNLTREHIEGRRILEIGAGDNFGVALQFIAAGAAQVVTLDKFAARRDAGHTAAVYRGMRERMGNAEGRNCDLAVDLSRGVRFNPGRLQTIEGVGTEEADRVLAPESFSLIVSRAVLEEIHEIDRAFRAMDRLLEPGGRMLHKIDMSDYGAFSNYGMHPLEFLTIPTAVYTLMSAYSGQPNRRRADYYRNKMRELGYSSSLLVTAVVGEPGEVLPHKPGVEEGIDYGAYSLDLVRGIRPRLAKPFRTVRNRDLLIAGVFLIARKPK
jgi:SAM-dependent methyltransferase